VEIIGNGFLAGSLRRIAGKHPDTVVLAAGVSWADGVSDAEFAREAALLHEVSQRCRRAGERLVFLSTASTGMYGGMDGPGREDRPATPCSRYGAHKLALEQRVRASGADHLVLRLGHLVGPGQPPHQLVPTLVRRIREGTVRIDRRATRDLVDVDDAVTIVDLLLAQGLLGETVNVASGTAVPVGHIVDHLERRLGLSTRREYRDAGMHNAISVDKLRSLVPQVAQLGFGPDYYRRVLDTYVGSGVAAARAR
jgi:nucleoside-diphosphate-sugar epimerase